MIPFFQMAILNRFLPGREIRARPLLTPGQGGGRRMPWLVVAGIAPMKATEVYFRLVWRDEMMEELGGVFGTGEKMEEDYGRIDVRRFGQSLACFAALVRDE